MFSNMVSAPPQRKVRLFATLGMVLAVLCGATACAQAPSVASTVPVNTVQPGEPVVAALPTNNSTQSAQAADIDWAQFKGKVVYIDFWASWCGPCRQSFPWMNAMHDKYAKDGLVILAVNVDQDPQKAAAFLKEIPANFNVKYDAKGKLASQFGVQTMPSSFILNRQGKPASKHMGFHERDIAKYEAELKTLLNQSVE